MCLASISDMTMTVSNKDIALYWWVQAFNYDYVKYAEALYPWDLDAQDNLLMNSYWYFNQVQNILNEQNLPLSLDLIASDINTYMDNIVSNVSCILN